MCTNITGAAFQRDNLRQGKFRDQVFDEQQQDEYNHQLSGRRRFLCDAASALDARKVFPIDQKRHEKEV